MKKVLIIVSVVVIALAGIGVGAYFLTRAGTAGCGDLVRR